MINHRIFVKGETIHALLSSYSHPNILIPVKAIVKDVKHDDVNPQYVVKVIQFYDNILFLRNYFFKMSFSNRFNKRARRIQLDYKKLRNVKSIIDVFNGPNEASYYIVVDSIMTVKLKGEMMALFSKIQNHLIERKLREVRDYMTRIQYSGTYRLTGDAEFNARLKKFIGDKIESAGMNFDKYTGLL